MKSTARLGILIPILALLASPSLRSATDPEYAVTDLGAFGPSGLNGHGDVVGYGSVDGRWQAVLWQQGVLSGLAIFQGLDAIPNRINDVGQISGMVSSGSGLQPFLYTAGMVEQPAVNSPGWYPVALNNSGTIVGTANGFIPFRFGSDGVHLLGMPGCGWGHAEDVNDAGLVVGIAVEGPCVGSRAVLWRDDVFELLPMPPGAAWTQAWKVNNVGQIAGTVHVDHTYPLLLNPGAGGSYTPIVISTPSEFLNGEGTALNDSGVMVGSGMSASDGAWHAFVWDDVRGMRDLNALGQLAAGTVLTVGTAINNRGQILAQGTVGGETHSFLLTPSDANAPVVQCESPDGAWRSANVALACAATDSGSGLANAADASFSLTTSVAEGVEDGNAATDSRTVCDNAGNCTTVGPYAGSKIDRKAPTISLMSPAGQTFQLGQVVLANYSCADGGSGVANCNGPVTTASAIDTSTVGSRTFLVTATDAVGHTSTATVTYSVTYGVCAQFDQAKAHKAGSTIPIKLNLCNASGVNVSSTSVPVVATAIYLASTNASGPLEDSGSANPDNQFRFAGGSYIFNLSLKGFSQGTWVLAFVASGDPISHAVQFQVR